MFGRDEVVLVAVSGGKDSLALWDVLIESGYQTVGMHLELGIAEYSLSSTRKTVAFAEARGQKLIRVDLGAENADVPTLAGLTRRPACAACGTAKRHHFDRVADEGGYAVLATGHNLDDEAARLLGNVMRWQQGYLAKQQPVLQPTHERFVRKVKPFYRLSEYETAVYAFLRGIDYVVEECPNSAGASQLVYKDVLNRLEAAMPGTKLTFFQEFLRTAQPLFQNAEASPPGTCQRCAMPAFGDRCSYCTLLVEVDRRRQQAESRGSGTTNPDV